MHASGLIIQIRSLNAYVTKIKLKQKLSFGIISTVLLIMKNKISKCYCYIEIKYEKKKCSNKVLVLVIIRAGKV